MDAAIATYNSATYADALKARRPPSVTKDLDSSDAWKGGCGGYLGAVRRNHIGHAVEAEIIARHVARMHGRAEPLIGMTTVDPAIAETVPVCRCVVVEHALGGMEHLLGRDTKHPELADHIGEIRVVRLVASDILGRVDGVEIDAEPRVAVGEAGIVDIRQDPPA